MLELRGFLDQITPMVKVSSFHSASAQEIISVIDDLRREMDFNHYAFYVKEYTNGYRSELPFLVNHPDTLNGRTDNRGFRDLTDALHERGISVGAVFQIYTFEASAWGEDKWGEWDVRNLTGMPWPSAMADATSPIYRGRLWAMMAEYMRLFPETDYIYIEGEGQSARMIETPLAAWLAERGGPSLEHLTYRDEDVAYCESLHLPLDIIWSQEAMDFAVAYSRGNFCVVEDALRVHGFKGSIGVVSHAFRVESRYMHRALPGPDWWLLPWAYMGWGKDQPGYAARIRACKGYFLEMKRLGHRVCYIGDAAMTGYLPPIRELWEVSRDHLDGYLGHGSLDVRLGRHWTGVTSEMVEAARRLYREEIFAKR